MRRGRRAKYPPPIVFIPDMGVRTNDMGTDGRWWAIRAQIIRSETHVRDGNYGGWIFDPTTSSHTITLQSHTMDELHMRCQPLIPYELVEVRRIAHLYVLFPGLTAEWRVL